jgi:hypothetical protein
LKSRVSLSRGAVCKIINNRTQTFLVLRWFFKACFM